MKESSSFQWFPLLKNVLSNKKQSLVSEKSGLESWLRAHDYVGTKVATGRATIDEYADIIAEMSNKASRINEIDELLKA